MTQFLSTKAVLGIIFVFIGCCLNIVFMELLIKEEPGCGSIVTGMQFIFVALYGYICTMKFGRGKNVIPIKNYIVLAAMFFLVNETNNKAFAYKISMPLHIIFRSGGLIASMVVGMIVLKRRYTMQKYASVILITLGTVLATLASSKQLESSSEETSSTVTTLLMGIAILTFALFLQARMGIFQECLYQNHGKHPDEALFFVHLLSLPGFVLSSGSIWNHAIKFTASEPLAQISGIPILESVPKLWIFCFGNMVTQYLCISSVFILTSECSALTTTMVLTLRKFVSLVFSIIYFKNSFTAVHWMGASMVFGGTLLFSGPLSPHKKTA